MADIVAAGVGGSASNLSVRVCVDCGQSKELKVFAAIKGTPYRHNRCNPCRVLRAKGIRPTYRLPTAEEIFATRNKRGPKPQFPPGVRVCTDCAQVRPTEAFVPIKGTLSAFYGACRDCRGRHERERRLPGEQHEERLEQKAAASPLGSLEPEPKLKSTVRTCTDCGRTRLIAEFTPIKACRNGWYGRCRECRARRARERYQADPEHRERQKARVRRYAAARGSAEA